MDALGLALLQIRFLVCMLTSWLDQVVLPAPAFQLTCSGWPRHMLKVMDMYNVMSFCMQCMWCLKVSCLAEMPVLFCLEEFLQNLTLNGLVMAFVLVVTDGDVKCLHGHDMDNCIHLYIAQFTSGMLCL